MRIAVAGGAGYIGSVVTEVLLREEHRRSASRSKTPRSTTVRMSWRGSRLLDAMRDGGVRQLVFSSTAAVYGEPVKQPIEEDDPTTPTNPYGETKLALERMLRWYADAYGLRSTSRLNPNGCLSHSDSAPSRRREPRTSR